MSSTVRAVLNEKRIATGKPWQNGFLQVYPEQKTFASEAEWRSQIYQSILSSLKFETEVEEQKEQVPFPKEMEKKEDKKEEVSLRIGLVDTVSSRVEMIIGCALRVDTITV
jgi:hypothetical protein